MPPIQPLTHEQVSALIEEQALTREEVAELSAADHGDPRAGEQHLQPADQGGAEGRVAPLRRPRGRGRRRRRRAARRRPDHQHPPRPRPRPRPRRQGRQDARGQAGALQQDDGRGARQVGRLLQGQGRLDAHRRRRARQPGRHRHRRRQPPRGGRRGAGAEAAGHRPGGGLLLRRRRLQRRQLPRGAEHGQRVEPAGGLRGREQPCTACRCRGPCHQAARHRRPRLRLRHPRRGGRRHGRAGRARGGRQSG